MPPQELITLVCRQTHQSFGPTSPSCISNQFILVASSSPSHRSFIYPNKNNSSGFDWIRLAVLQYIVCLLISAPFVTSSAHRRFCWTHVSSVCHFSVSCRGGYSPTWMPVVSCLNRPLERSTLSSALLLSSSSALQACSSVQLAVEAWLWCLFFRSFPSTIVNGGLCQWRDFRRA